MLASLPPAVLSYLVSVQTVLINFETAQRYETPAHAANNQLLLQAEPVTIKAAHHLTLWSVTDSGRPLRMVAWQRKRFF